MEVTIRRLVEGTDEAERLGWAERLVHVHWPELQYERGEGWPGGWPELVGSMATVIELLARRLPPQVEAAIVGGPAEAEWRRRRAPFQRFALAVGPERVHLGRVFSTRAGDALVTRPDLPRFTGRSHTLLLALMHADAFPASFGPVAVTGAVGSDGESIETVEEVTRKAEAWFTAEPAGWFVSPPVPGVGALERGHRLHVDEPSHHSHWIMGASIPEVRAKLLDDRPGIAAWDGHPIPEAGLVRPKLRWHGDPPAKAPYDDGLVWAVQAATGLVTDAPAARGVLVTGAPGAGKSIWSRHLERQFRVGALGAIGLAVRRAARELMLDALDGTGWVDVLSRRDEGRRDLFASLARTGRLVVIVDGLDELDLVDLKRLADMLREAPGPWIVTGRPIAAITRLLPAAFHLRIEDLSADEGRKVLEGLNRGDLAERALPEKYGQGKPTSAAIAELCRTPFHLTLLARVVSPGESLDDLTVHELYRRAFDGLLTQARMDNRLDASEERLLRGLLDSLVGGLALDWLSSESRYLSRASVDRRLGVVGFSLKDRADVIRALEFGYLLAPASGEWDFAHRTIAEWAGARALEREVAEALSGLEPTDAFGRSREELRVLAKFLHTEGLAHSSKHAHLLVFYGPFVAEPMALLRHLVGAPSRPRWRVGDEQARWRRRAVGGERDDAIIEWRLARSDELEAEWDFALRLMSSCKWHRRGDARAAWAIVVRADRRGFLSDRRHARPDAPRHPVEGFASAIASHLPRRFDELVALAAGNSKPERDAVTEDISVLLRAVPPACSAAVEELFARGSPQEQLASLAWFERHRVAAPAAALCSLAAALPDEIRAAELKVPRGSYDRTDASDRLSLLKTLENEVWRAAARSLVQLPWSVARLRLAEWPRHLWQGFESWFGMELEARFADALQHRRVATSVLLDPVARTCEVISSTLASIETARNRDEVVHAVRKRVDDEDDHYRRRRFDAFVTARGWDVPHFGPGGGDGGGEIEVLCACIRRLQGDEGALAMAIKALHPTSLDAVVGELLSTLPLGDSRRVALIDVCLENRRTPKQIPMATVLRAIEKQPYLFREHRWTPPQRADLLRLATEGDGEDRFRAIGLLARIEGRDEHLALLAALPGGDVRFVARVREQLAQRGVWDDVPVELLPPDVLAAMPLAFRAERHVPGWRAELLAAADAGREGATAVASLAAKLQVHEVVPLLARWLDADDYQTSALIDAIGTLATDDDEEWARAALRARLRQGGYTRGRRLFGDRDEHLPWARLLRFLRLDDLELVASGSTSALQDEPLVAAIRALGTDGFETLLRQHEVATRRLTFARTAAKAHESDSRSQYLPRTRGGPEDRLKDAESTWSALGDTIAAVIDPTSLALDAIVALCFRVTGGDVHEVYSTPGPLGSDFDEPGDQEWSSTHKNAPVIEALSKACALRLEVAPSEWPALRGLFQHPSEALRKRAFEASIRLAQSHEVVSLALAALEGHLRCNRTKWTGNTAGLLLAGMEGGGSGSIGIEVPDTAETLVGAVRRQLTAVHTDAIAQLTKHPLSPFRALAAKWAGEMGPPAWVEMVIPLLADADAHVVRRALGAIRELAPARVADEIKHADRSCWTGDHDYVVLHDLMFQVERRFEGVDWETETDADPLRVLPGATLISLLTEAAERLPKPAEGVHKRTAFDGLPCLVERGDRYLRGHGGVDGSFVEQLQRWCAHPDPRVRAVARRCLAERGDLEASHLEGMLQAGHPQDRLSATECLTRLAVFDCLPEIFGYWEAAWGYSSWKTPAETLRVLGFPPGVDEPARGRREGDAGIDKESLKPRLEWALQGASVRFAPLLTHLARNIYQAQDDEEGDTETPRMVIDTVERWGAAGALALLLGLESRTIDDHYYFADFLIEAARKWSGFEAAVRARAADSEVAAGLVAQLDAPSDEAVLDARARVLEEEVFAVSDSDREIG